jgi:hypothetical protein
MVFAYKEVGKGRKQDAEALSSSDSFSLKHMDVLNGENARSYFLLRPDFPRIKPISKGLFKIVMSC